MAATKTDPSPAAASRRDRQRLDGIHVSVPGEKEIPEMNAELIRRYIRRMVIVYATMGTDGKLQKLSVRESPDVRFNRPILAALNHWSFRPAQLNGQAVALKVLIGIPILPFE